MKRLFFTLLFFSTHGSMGMDELFPVFENCPAWLSTRFNLSQLARNPDTSRCSFVEGPSSQKGGYCVSLESLLKVFENPESTGSVNYLIDENEQHEPRFCKVSKCSHTGIMRDPVPTIFFDLKQIPRRAFLEQLKPIATDDGLYQMVRVRAPRGNISTTRDLERSAQQIGFSFYARRGRPHLEWRRLSKKAFQAKIRQRSPGAAKGGTPRAAKSVNSRNR